VRRLDPATLEDVRRRIAHYEPAPNLRQLLALEGTPVAALLFGRWFFPSFVERDGCILNDDRFDEASLGAWQDAGVPNASIEAVINRVDIRAEWPNEEAPVELCHELVQVLAHTWYAALDQQFPDRTFILLVGEGEQPTDLTVFQPGDPTTGN
jgi:hypothetical protein